MSDRITTHQLLSHLSDHPHIPTLRALSGSVIQPAPEPETFIEPDLKEVNSGGTGAVTDILLLTAPAAVGKSVLARKLSAESGNPLWDLSQFRVGDNFFTGTMARAYGGTGYAKWEALLRSGDASLILDAADEALVRAGLPNFEAAVSDLAELVGTDSKSKTPVVILGRPETVDLAGVLLDEQGLTWRLLAVDFFDEARSRDFIRVKAERLAGGSEAPGLQDFLDEFFSSVRRAIESGGLLGAEPESFVGYAPVLDALATYVAEQPNAHALFEQLKKDSAGTYVWNLLSAVMSEVCARETAKYSASFSAGDDIKRAVAEETFSLRQQAHLLLAEDIAAVDVVLPEAAPREWRQDLIVAARQQISEHPFLKLGGSRRSDNPLLRFTNAAFRDFIVSWMLANCDETELDNARLAIYLADARVVPSPMLVRLITTPVLASKRSLSHRAIGPIVASASVSLSLSHENALHLHLGEYVLSDTEEEEDLPPLSMEFTEAGQERGILTFQARERIRLTLDRAAAHCTIDLPSGEVVIGQTTQDFVAGPRLNVHAGEVFIEAENFRVLSSGPGEGVWIRTPTFRSVTQRLRAASPEELTVQAPNLAFPWHDYAGRLDNGSVTDFDLQAAGLELRRICGWFARPTMTGRLRYPKRAMDNILSKRRVSREMFDFCMSRGVITSDEDEYAFHEPPRVDTVKRVSIEDEDFRCFLTDYINRSSDGEA